MKPKLFLHIGTHKTASTVIQKALDLNRVALVEHGVLYPKTTRGKFPGLPKHDLLFETLLDPSPVAFESELKAFLDEFEASGCTTMILSEEALSEPRYGPFDKMRRFAEYFDIEVICYFRRPDYFLESLWNQRCKEGVFAATVGTFARVEFNLERLQYDRIIDWWSEFAKVRVVNYEAVQSGAIVTSFSEQIGFELAVAEDERINVSPSAQCALLMAALNAKHKPYNSDKVLAAFAGDRQKHALGRKLRKKILARQANSLARLEAEHGLRFDMTLPDEPEHALVRLHPDICARAIARLL